MTPSEEDVIKGLLALTTGGDSSKPAPRTYISWAYYANTELRDAEDVAKEIEILIGNQVTEYFPARATHLNAQKASSMVEISPNWKKTPKETDEDFMERMQRPRARVAAREESWIKCAIWTGAAIKYVSKCQPDLFLYSPIQKFYKHLWLCLQQGKGEAGWIQFPKHLPRDHSNPHAWFSGEAERIIDKAVRFWERGMSLAQMILRAPYSSSCNDGNETKTIFEVISAEVWGNEETAFCEWLVTREALVAFPPRSVYM